MRQNAPLRAQIAKLLPGIIRSEVGTALHGQTKRGREYVSSLLMCRCLGSVEVPHEGLLSAFRSLRRACPALRLLVPDELWQEFAAWDNRGDHDAFHRSIILLALERGHLGRLTWPIHRFLLDGDHPRADLRRQYIEDLSERWMFADDALERHRRSRSFTGRLTELQVAAWLETEGWSVTGLEALRLGPDIEAVRDEVPHAFEIKAMGRQDEAFESMLESLRNQPALRWMSPDAAANYALFRVYEAGKQLAAHPSPRVAVLVIEELAWHDFNLQLREGWVDWAKPQFLGDDPEWEAFFRSQEEGRYPQIREELEQVIAGLDAIWIVQRFSGFEYRRELVISPRAVAAFSPTWLGLGPSSPPRSLGQGGPS